MKDATLDAMIEAENARIWEELNKEDPKAQAAATKLRLVLDLIERAESVVLDAADDVEHTPETDRIASINIDLENVENAIREQIGRLQ